MKKNIVFFLSMIFCLIGFSRDFKNEDKVKKRPDNSNLIVFQININQPFVEECYDETSIPPVVSDLIDWIRVFPNPNQGIFNLEVNTLKEGEEINIMIINVSGLKSFSDVFVAENNYFRKKLDLSFLAKGMYFLHIWVDERIIVKQIIII
jgi:hypothetical protein